MNPFGSAVSTFIFSNNPPNDAFTSIKDRSKIRTNNKNIVGVVLGTKGGGMPFVTIIGICNTKGRESVPFGSTSNKGFRRRRVERLPSPPTGIEPCRKHKEHDRSFRGTSRETPELIMKFAVWGLTHPQSLPLGFKERGEDLLELPGDTPSRKSSLESFMVDFIVGLVKSIRNEKEVLVQGVNVFFNHPSKDMVSVHGTLTCDEAVERLRKAIAYMEVEAIGNSPANIFG